MAPLAGSFLLAVAPVCAISTAFLSYNASLLLLIPIALYCSVTLLARALTLCPPKGRGFTTDATLFNTAESMLAVTMLGLQIMLMDPVLRAALLAHSRLRRQPLVRILRTMAALELIVRGTPEERRKVAEWIKRMHVHVKGKTYVDGKIQTYGFTQDLQTWVLASLAQANLVFEEEHHGVSLGVMADKIVARALLFQRRLCDVSIEELPLDRAQLAAYMEERKELLNLVKATEYLDDDSTAIQAGTAATPFKGPLARLVLKLCFAFARVTTRLLMSASSGQATWGQTLALKALKVAYFWFAALVPVLTPRGVFALSCGSAPSLFSALVAVHREILGTDIASEDSVRAWMREGQDNPALLNHLLKPSLNPLERATRLPKIFLAHFWESGRVLVDQFWLRFLWAELGGMKRSGAPESASKPCGSVKEETATAIRNGSGNGNIKNGTGIGGRNGNGSGNGDGSGNGNGNGSGDVNGSGNGSGNGNGDGNGDGNGNRNGDGNATIGDAALQHRAAPAGSLAHDGAKKTPANGNGKQEAGTKKAQESGAAKLPAHVGIILDGNRRFAKKSGRHPLYGHAQGTMKTTSVLEWAFHAGVRNVTLWIFSDDNFKRSQAEVEGLMRLFEEESEDKLYDGVLFTYKVRVAVVGDRSMLPETTRVAMSKIEAATAHHTGRTLVIAMAYGGRSEITAAVKNTLSGLTGQALEDRLASLSEADINAQSFCARVGVPPVDAIIRTSGERRLSGFMLWDSVYCELAFVDKNWPELDERTFLRTLLDLSKRARRRGA